MQQDGEGRDFAHTLAGDEGSADSQAVGKVVERVGKKIQVSGNFDLTNDVRMISVLLGFLLKKSIFIKFLKLDCHDFPTMHMNQPNLLTKGDIKLELFYKKV